MPDEAAVQTQGDDQANQDAAAAEQQQQARLLAGKFKSVEDLEKSYLELQKKLGQRSQQKGKDTPKGLEIPKPSDEVPSSVSDLLRAIGKDEATILQEWAEGRGRLKDETYIALAAKGFGRGLVDEVIRAKAAEYRDAQARQELIAQRAAELAGGQEQLQTLLAWAGQNLPDYRIQDLNERLARESSYEGAIVEIMTEYNKAVGAGKASPLISGGTTPPASGAGCRTPEEYLELIRQINSAGGKPTPEQIAKLANTPREIVDAVSGFGQ